MITMENTQGVSVITLTNFEKYNGDTPNDTLHGTPKYLNSTDLQALTAHLTAQVTAQVMENLQKEGHTYGTNNKKEEEYISKETSSDEDAKKDPLLKTRFDNLTKWMQENTPNVLKLSSPLTEKQYAKIKEKYRSEQLKHILLAMENYKELNKKYRSVYLTFLKWANKEYGT